MNHRFKIVDDGIETYISVKDLLNCLESLIEIKEATGQKEAADTIRYIVNGFKSAKPTNLK
jgi:hypothetical protein